MLNIRYNFPSIISNGTMLILLGSIKNVSKMSKSEDISDIPKNLAKMSKSGDISVLPGNLAKMSVSAPKVEQNYTLNLKISYTKCFSAAMILVSPRMRWFVTVV